MKKTLITILCLIPMWLNAQLTKTDSLINILETQQLPIEKQLKLYDDICENYCQTDPVKSLLYGKRGLNLAEKINDKKMIASLSLHVGMAYFLKEPVDSSLIYTQRAIVLAQEINDKKIEATALGSLAFWYYNFKNDYETGLDYYFQALSLYKSINNTNNTVRLLVNISGIYYTMHQYEYGFKYIKEAQTYMEKIDNPRLKTAVYESLGSYYLHTGNFEAALENMLIALDMSRKHKLIRYEVVTTQFLAGIYSDGFQDYEMAEKYALECEKAALSIDNKELLITAWNILAKVYIDAGKYRKGKDVALKIWDNDSTEINSAINMSYQLAICYMYSDEKEKALYYFNKHDSLRVAEAQEQFHNSISNMEVKYETEKKEMRITTLEEEQKLYTIVGVVIGIALLLILCLLFYRHRLAIQKRKLIEQQMKQLEQEKELIATRAALEAEKVEREVFARDLHDGVGAMLSVVKNNMDLIKSHSITENEKMEYLNKALDGLNKSITELRRVAHHIMPAILVERGLFIALDDFCRVIPEVEFHSSESDYRFDPEKELVLYRCAYELISNALRHGKASHINVHLNMNDKTVYLSVVDNGCGFDPQTALAGMGIYNMRTRLSVFGGHIDIYSEAEKGTEVNIELEL